MRIIFRLYYWIPKETKGPRGKGSSEMIGKGVANKQHISVAICGLCSTPLFPKCVRRLSLSSTQNHF